MIDVMNLWHAITRWFHAYFLENTVQVYVTWFMYLYAGAIFHSIIWRGVRRKYLKEKDITYTFAQGCITILGSLFWFILAPCLLLWVTARATVRSLKRMKVEKGKAPDWM